MLLVLLQPLDKMEQTEIQKQAEKFVDPGFKLATQTKVRGALILRWNRFGALSSLVSSR